MQNTNLTMDQEMLGKIRELRSVGRLAEVNALLQNRGYRWRIVTVETDKWNRTVWVMGRLD